MLIPALELPYLAKTSLISPLSAVCVIPTLILVICRSSSVSSLCIFSYSAFIRLAYFMIISPSGVSLSSPFPRLNIFTPSSFSSWLIWWLTAGCVNESSSAALVKLFFSYTVKRVSSLISSI